MPGVTNRQRGRPDLGAVVVDGDAREADQLSGLLAAAGIPVLGQASSAGDGATLAAARRPAVVVVATPLAATPGALEELGGAAPGSAIVVVGEDAGAPDVLAAVLGRCDGVADSGGAVVPVVRAAAAGAGLAPIGALRRALAPAGSPPDGLPELTGRERDVLALLAEGRSTREIAEALFLSINTVRNHIQSLLGTLGAHSRLEAVALARSAGLVPPGS